MIETNVDDVTGEVLSMTVERLLSQGAEDAYATSYIGKKDRPGYNLKVLCKKGEVRKFAEIIIEETGTLGVKTIEYTRLAIPRKIVLVPCSIKNFSGKVRVKVSINGGRVLRIKPEFEDAKKLAKSQGLPLRVVLEEISSAAKGYLAQSSNIKQKEEA